MKPLHHKTHTLAKRGLSLLCVLALCLSLLPVTALAAGDAPATLYVGNQVLRNNISYWKTDPATGELTEYTEDGDAWNVKYDPSTATLTLRDATIKTTHNNGKGAVIYAESSSSSAVSLTIELEGRNTIECASAWYGIYVNAEMSETSYGTDASLTITGQGSLDVSGSSCGIWVKSGSGNASLTIEKATVTSSTDGEYAAGVYVQSSTFSKNSPALSLAVDGGSLTTSASEGNDGIQFYVGSSSATNPTTSLTVSGNAIVDAKTGGIRATGVDITLIVNIGSTGGIVFDGTEGTVYGKVTLDESLTIDQGETLTIPDGSSLTSNDKLTNNGTVTIENGGTLTDADKVTNNGTINVKDGGKLEGTPIGGTVVNAPAITAQPANQTVTEGQSASFTVAASGEALSYQWQQSADNGLSWTDIDGATSATHTIAATSTDMSGTQYRCVVSNSAGSVTSDAATLTVNAATVPVTDVSLDKGTISLFTGESETLTAMVVPVTATDKSVTWESSDDTIATVEDGTVTAVGAGNATITVTTQDGGKTDTCTVTVTDKTYTISADTTALDFGSAYTGYAQPAAQTVTVKNTGNQPVTLNQPSSTDNFEVGALSTTSLPVNGTATFTVQPKTGLSAGTYNENITVSGSENVTVTIPASFTVKSRPSYNPPTVSEKTIDAIADAQPGETVTVDLSHGSTKLDKEVFETLAGKDITLAIDLGDGVFWTVKGSDIPENADFVDIDLGVTMNSDGIPVDLINAITGEHGSVQMTLAHDGAFGFTMTLTAPLGTENAGYWANLYYFNESTNKMTFETAAPIGSDGSVSLAFSHASQYAIVIDDHNHGVVTLPFTDVSEGDWFYDPVCYVYSQGLMTGTSATTFEPNTHLSRAMLVAVLHRLEGSPQASVGDFIDVAEGDWYAQAVNWAASVGVVNGFDDGTFQPNTAITREQLAAILMNYAQYKGQDVSARATFDTYNDATAISSWANDVMSWAVAEGLLTGVTNDQLQPQGNATRAQVAAILQRFLSE